MSAPRRIVEDVDRWPPDIALEDGRLLFLELEPELDLVAALERRWPSRRRNRG